MTQEHLGKLFDSYTEDSELLNLIPFPLEDHPNGPLVLNLAKMRDGQRDFDIFCILWHKSQPVQQYGGPGKKKKDERTYVLPSLHEFDVTFYPRVIQDELGKMNNALHAVTEERKRVEREKTRQAEIDKKKQEALDAAAKKLEEDKKSANAKALALVVTNHAATLNKGSKPEENETENPEVCNFCYCSYFFG